MGKYFAEEEKKKKKEDIEEVEDTEHEEETEEDEKIKTAADKGKYRLRWPIEFEGEKIEEIDISGLEDLKGRDLEQAANLLVREGKIRYFDENVYDSNMFRKAILIVKTKTPEGLLDELKSIDYIVLLNVVSRFLLKTR